MTTPDTSLVELDVLIQQPCTCRPLPEPHCNRCEEILERFAERDARIQVLERALERLLESHNWQPEFHDCPAAKNARAALSGAIGDAIL